MKHKDKRIKMKALAISRFIIEQNMKLRVMSDWQRTHMAIQIERQVLAMNQIPAKLFRHDRPVLDKRRYKRYQRKQMKGAFLVKVNT